MEFYYYYYYNSFDLLQIVEKSLEFKLLLVVAVKFE